MSERFVEVEGLFNVRDIGGYATAAGGTVRWGRVFRGCQPCGLSDVALGQLGALGLRTVVDLREDREVDAEPCTPLGVTVHRNPIYRGRVALDGLPGLDALYVAVLELAAAEFIAALEVLAAPEALPVLVHCTAGKDRTGLLIALLLDVLGVDEDTIVEDYALTEQAYTAEYRADMTARAEAIGIGPQRLALMIGSAPEMLRVPFAALREKYGSVEAYLVAEGARPALLAALRKQLVS